MINLITRYAAGSFTYGFLRGTTRALNLKYGDDKTEALPAQKTAAVIMSTVFAPSFVPIYLYNDVNRFYLTYTNGDFKKYGYSKVDTSVLQILFE